MNAFSYHEWFANCEIRVRVDVLVPDCPDEQHFHRDDGRGYLKCSRLTGR